MSSAEIREVAVAVGKTIESASVVQAGGRIGDGAGSIPLFPGSAPSDRLSYTVVIDRNYGGQLSSTLVDVFSSTGQLPLSQIIDRAISAVDAIVRPSSPPPFDPNNSGRVTSARVISVYYGEPIGS